jgi:branched-chain amino acid transport system substrate-binding protein
VKRVVLLLAAMTALTSAAPAQERPAYELDAILPLTGAAAFFGQSSAKTMTLIADRVNATGGIHGRPLRIAIADDQSSPQVAVQLATAVIAKKAPLLLGPGITSTCSAVAPLVAASGPVMFCISPFIATGPYVYVTAGTALDSAVVTLRHYRLRGFTRFAMLNATDASGQALDKAFRDAFALHENRGLTLVASAHFGPADQSVAAQISLIQAAAPQVLISWTVGSPFSTVIRGMHDAGFDIPLCTNGANMTKAQISQFATSAPSELDFLTIPTAVRGSVVPARIAQRQRGFEALFAAAGIVPDGGYANAYDTVSIAVDALRHTPPDPTAAQLRAYLSTLHDYAGANALYDFRFGERGSGQDGFELARYAPAQNDFVPISRPGGAPLPFLPGKSSGPHTPASSR